MASEIDDILVVGAGTQSAYSSIYDLKPDVTRTFGTLCSSSLSRCASKQQADRPGKG
jgi:hypothetical protein